MSRERDEDLRENRRSSPYQQMDDEDPSQDVYGTYQGDAYDEEYEEEQPSGGFLSTTVGKLLVGLIVLLVVVLGALLAVRFIRKPTTPQANPTLAPAVQPTATPGTIVFAPVTQQNTQAPTEAPTQAPTSTPQPTATPTAVPTNTPAPTATPLPVILTNTPTPTPSPTPTATPAPTPTPSPTPIPEIGTGKTNRDANLRETASSSGKVKQSVKKGEALVIHEAVLDKTGKAWYHVTVTDVAATGWMRDYVVDADGKIPVPTATPKATAEPKDQAQTTETTAKPTATPNSAAIGAGVTVKEANLRKIMNGKVLTQLRKGKRVDILAVKADKNGAVWYEVQPQGSTTIGYVRDYLIKLDDGVKLELPEGATQPTPSPTPKPTATPKAEETAVVPDVLDREIIGKANTNRAANVRVTPSAGSKLVRQLSKGIELMILEIVQDADGHVWYEVSTESGKTHGFVRDYVLDVKEIDRTREAKPYAEE
ncbi:MAG: SH3 domain-containing protein [Candidatus Ventricola sp.]